MATVIVEREKSILPQCAIDGLAIVLYHKTFCDNRCEHYHQSVSWDYFRNSRTVTHDCGLFQDTIVYGHRCPECISYFEI